MDAPAPAVPDLAAVEKERPALRGAGGADPEEAAMLAGSSDGPWHLSRTPLLSQLFPNSWFLKHGLPRFHVQA